MMMGTSIVPMEPVKYDQPFDDNRYTFQVKWDGVRMLAFVGSDGVRLQNRRLRDRTHTYPELGILSQRLQAEEAILDGEVVVLQAGKPSFPQVIERDLATNDRSIAGLVKSLPIVYVVFDLLWINGRDLTGLSWRERDAQLRSVVKEEGPVAVIDNFIGRGIDLFGAVESKGLEGMVAKRMDSRYLVGQKDDAWRKVKCWQHLRCVVGGMSLKGPHFSALLLGVYHHDQLIYVGRVGTGVSDAEAEMLVKHLRQQQRPQSPFVNPPAIRSAEVVWVYPALTVEVEFLEWTEDLQLRSPAIKGFGTGDPKDCVMG